jgi:hypothetical protein
VIAGRAVWIISCLGLFGLATPVSGQVSLGADLTTDYRLRGYSLSRGRPAASAHIGYDDASGVFVDGSTTLLISSDGTPRWMGSIMAIGYARQITKRMSVDAGLMRLQLSPSASLGRAGGYTELFVGLTGPVLSGRIAYSPDYFRPSTATLYGSLEAVGRHDDWRVFGHLGALARLGAMPAFPVARTQYDWRVGVGKQLSQVDLEIGMSGGGPNQDYYNAAPHSKTALVGNLRFIF